MTGALSRILIRYGVGFLLGSSVADLILADSDIMTIVVAATALVVSAVTEWAYRKAKRLGDASKL